MKNHFKLAFGIVLFFSVVYWSIIENSQRKFASLVLQNIEALADNEHVIKPHCLDVGSVDCPIGNVKVGYVIYGTRCKW